MWNHPPQPPPRTNRPPEQTAYFAAPLLLWMPKRLWGVTLRCPHLECPGRQGRTHGHPLTAAGIYHRVRRVLGLRGYYHLAAEYLECRRCSRKVISWSSPVVEQLDLAHRSHFRVILTYRCAFDLEVVRLLRDRGLGNSPSRLYRQLLEEHEEEWMARQLRFLSDSVGFQKFVRNPPPPLPDQSAVLKYQSLLKAYVLDAHSRLETSKALITSVFGRVLKMDSSKKVRIQCNDTYGILMHLTQITSA